MTTSVLDRPRTMPKPRHAAPQPAYGSGEIVRPQALGLSVIVLTYNRLAALQRCLDHILERTNTPHFEVIVVNNGSTDGTKEWLKTLADDPFITAIHLPENEFVCARNYGLAIARAPIIAQVDDDVLVHSQWDVTLLAPFEDERVGAAGQMAYYQDATWETLIDDRRRPQPGQYADLLTGFCWAWRNDRLAPNADGAAESCFRYDWAFNPGWHEESDLQLQIKAAGYRLMTTPDVVTHNSLHDWQATHEDRGPFAISIAERNFHKLKDKWQGHDIIWEGKLVGL